ncbi:MAG: hypothetical protein H7145_06620 [Akkermansiaceae bacterium]|nr:hypothetical protein [Armatimonadota bacterium]
MPCSAQVGALYLKDCTEAPEEMFGLPDGPDAETPYHMVRRVGFFDGFYDLQGGVPFEMWLVDGEWVSGETLYGDCFFPRVTPAFWETLQRGEGDLDQLFSCHGLVLYAGPKTKEAGVNMVALLDEPFSDEGQFLRTATDLYAVLVLTGHDGQFFHAFAKSADDFALLEPALSDAVRAVEGSDWFRTNKARLAWSEELDACLMLPISRAVEANT